MDNVLLFVCIALSLFVGFLSLRSYTKTQRKRYLWIGVLFSFVVPGLLIYSYYKLRSGQVVDLNAPFKPKILDPSEVGATRAIDQGVERTFYPENTSETPFTYNNETATCYISSVVIQYISAESAIKFNSFRKKIIKKFKSKLPPEVYRKISDK